MKKRFIHWICLFLMLLPLVTTPAYADCAPKPTTHVTIHDARGKRVLVTLLSQEDSTGPHATVEPGQDPDESLSKDAQAAFLAFRDYVDADGFHFLGVVQDGDLSWNYYPPETFKVALYVPEDGKILVSREIYTRYAFHSDYRLWVDVTGYDQSGSVSMAMKKDQDLAQEIWEFLGRVVLTLAVELGVALVFGYRNKRQLKIILGANLITQVGLNLCLTVWYFFQGPLDALIRLALGEVLVLIVESSLYAKRLKGEKGGAFRPIAYAIVANLASVWIGWQVLT